MADLIDIENYQPSPCSVKEQYDGRVLIRGTIGYGTEAEMARQMLVTYGLAVASNMGSGSLLPPEEVVERALAIACQFHHRARTLGLLVDIPATDDK